MNVISNCAWCKSRYSTTIPELCEDLREAIEEGDEHNALIMAFATELALFQEQWPYCSRRCENDDADYPWTIQSVKDWRRPFGTLTLCLGLIFKPRPKD
jgi:hypothetical protein